MKIIKKLFNIKDKYHWYTVKFYYRTIDGFLTFDFTNELGVANKNEILNHRSLKKYMDPMHKLNKGSQKNFICNGTLSCEVVCYLGYFAKPLNQIKNVPKRKKNKRSIWRFIR